MKNKSTKIIFSIIISAVLFCLFVFFNSSQKTYTKEGYYFDTYNFITVYSKKDSKNLDKLMNKLAYYDRLFDRNNEASDIAKINLSNQKPVTVQSETYELLQIAYDYCEESNGAADITIAPVLNVWNFENGRDTLPSESEINEALELTDYKNLKFLGDNTVLLEGEDTKIDLGFIAKGYIADKIKEEMIAMGIDKALISLGGNILVIGQKGKNKPFVIGVRDPENQNNTIAETELSNESLVTSGTYERYVEIDGIKYHHILDTATGFPVSSSIKAVTVKAPSSVDADALSTICLILGEEKSQNILQRHNATAIFY